jgi:hypothetical protein
MDRNSVLPSLGILILLSVATIPLLGKPVAALPAGCTGTKLPGLNAGCSFQCTPGAVNSVSASSVAGNIQVVSYNCGNFPSCTTPTLGGACFDQAPSVWGNSGACIASGAGAGSFACSG